MAKIADVFSFTPDHMKLSLLDVLIALDPSKTNKYTELMVRLFDQYAKNDIENYFNYRNDLLETYDVSLPEYDLFTIRNISTVLSNYKPGVIKSILRFVNACEKNNFKGLDITQIKSIGEVEQYLNSINLKSITKKLAKQVIKDYEDDEWLIVRPFTWEAAVKYGYNTRWCTSMETEPQHFFEYTKNGKLIYCINKNTGKKVAIYKKINEIGFEDLSFWDSSDNRVDSIMSELPEEILVEIKNILFIKDLFLNRELNSKSWDTSLAMNHKKLGNSEMFDIPYPINIQNFGEVFVMENTPIIG